MLAPRRIRASVVIICSFYAVDNRSKHSGVSAISSPHSLMLNRPIMCLVPKGTGLPLSSEFVGVTFPTAT